MFVRPNPTGHLKLVMAQHNICVCELTEQIPIRSTENITSFGVVTQLIYFAGSTSGAVGVLPLQTQIYPNGRLLF